MNGPDLLLVPENQITLREFNQTSQNSLNIIDVSISNFVWKNIILKENFVFLRSILFKESEKKFAFNKFLKRLFDD